MFCPQCGVQNADDHNFCAGCGAPLRTSAPVAATPPPGYPAQPAPPPPRAPGAMPPPPTYPQPPYGPVQPARKTNVFAIVLFGLVMLAVGGAGAYFVLNGGIPWPLGQASMQSYSDPQGRFKIRYPRGWTVHPLKEGTLFSPQADIGPASSFSLAQVTGPTIAALHVEKVNKEITAAQALADSGLKEDSETRILGQRSGKVATASGAVEAVWVDVLLTEPSSRTSQNKQFRVRVLTEVRHPGDGTTITGSAACLSPPDAFAAFDRLCSSALDSYELGTP